MCIFSYWIYHVAPGCIIVHLPLTTVGVCVDPSGGGQVYVAGNVHVTPRPSSVRPRLPPILSHSRAKTPTASWPALRDIVAIHVSSVRVAGWPLMLEGLHGDVGGGVTVVLPSGHVSATAQDASACLCLASAVLSMVLSLDASEAELELLLAVFVFGLTLVFVIV